MPNLTTIAEWAKSLNISRQQGYAAISRCQITVEDGKVDSEYATMLYHRHTRARANAKGGAAPPPGENGAFPAAQGADVPAGATAGYDVSRAKREAAEAQMAEIKLGELAGRFLVKDDVEAALFEVARALRDGLTNCGRRIAGDVVGLTDAGACEEIIDREHRVLLQTLSKELMSKVGADLEDVLE
jgi:hypothetical protein